MEDYIEKSPELQRLRQLCKDSLFILCKAVLGFTKFSNLHRIMCKRAERVLANIKEGKGMRSVELWPRGHYKSSCYSIGLPIFLYLNNNNWRTLLAGSTATNSSMRLTRVQRVFTSNPLFQALFPEYAVLDTRRQKWTEFVAMLPRKHDFVEATFEAMGVGGRVTGRHYDIIITDDLVDETCLGPDGLPSETMMNAAIQWHDYMDFLFDVPEKGIEVMPCTRWAMNDLVGHIIENDKRYEVTRHSALGGCCEDHPDNTVLFPEQFTREALEVQRKKDPYKFALQMLNNPIDKDITDIQTSWLEYYDFNKRGDITLHDGKTVPIHRLNVYTTIDPAFKTKSKNDYTAIVTFGITSPFKIFILDIKRMRASPELIIDGLLDTVTRWRPLSVGVETVAAQLVLKSFIEYIARERDIQLNLVELKPPKNAPKETRIRALVPYFRNHQIYLSLGMNELLDEIERFPFGNHDDLLDALAYGQQLWREPSETEWSTSDEYIQDVVMKDRNTVTGY